jgi:branched-subunit amino acid transport protein AzlD
LLGVFVQPRIASNERERFPFLNSVSDAMATYAGELLALAILVVLVVWVYTKISYSRAPYTRDVLTLAVINPAVASMIAIALGLLALGAGIYFGWSAAQEIGELILPILQLFRSAFTRNPF